LAEQLLDHRPQRRNLPVHDIAERRSSPIAGQWMALRARPILIKPGPPSELVDLKHRVHHGQVVGVCRGAHGITSATDLRPELIYYFIDTLYQER
jgi:hypothetical protein